MHLRISSSAAVLFFAICFANPPGFIAAQQAAPVVPSMSVDRDPIPSPDADIAPAAAGPGTTAPQSGDQVQRAGGTYTLRTAVGEVRLNASVLDSNGRAVQTLPREAFQVFEDGVQQTVASFRHEDLPVSLGVLIDSSGSMYDKRSAVGKASLDLIRLSNPQDEAFLVDFSWEAFIDQDFTKDIKKLEEGLNYVKGQRRHGNLRRGHRLGGLPLAQRQAAQAGAAADHRWGRQRIQFNARGDHPSGSGTGRPHHLLRWTAVWAG